jgi:hypothetical protein
MLPVGWARTDINRCFSLRAISLPLPSFALRTSPASAAPPAPPAAPSDQALHHGPAGSERKAYRLLLRAAGVGQETDQERAGAPTFATSRHAAKALGSVATNKMISFRRAASASRLMGLTSRSENYSALSLAISAASGGPERARQNGAAARFGTLVGPRREAAGRRSVTATHWARDLLLIDGRSD